MNQTKTGAQGSRLAARLATFLVVFLLVMLPVSVSAQLSAISAQNGATSLPEEKPAVPAQAQEVAGYLSAYSTAGGAEPQAFCIWPAKDCQNKCWGPCWFGNTWYCGSSGAVCCESSAKFCDSSAGKCWTNCPSGQTWVCKSTGAVCVSNCIDKDGDGYGSGCSKGSDCNDNDANINPGKAEVCGDGKDNNCNGQTDEGCCSGNRECNGICWGGCPSGQTWYCVSIGGMCCTPDSKWCGGICWLPCSTGQTWNCGSDGKAYCTTPCTDNDGDGYGSGCSKGSDCNDNDANINPGKAEVCGDGKDNNCNGQTDEGCCSNPTPYNCGKTSSCWLNKAQCDQAISCGNYWAACVNPSGNVIKCVRGQSGCCNAAVPYFCPENGYCFASDGFCDGRQVYNCNGKYQVCNKKTDSGACFGDVLNCCPSGETWWESDSQCHKSSEPPKCAVPDGSSAACKCSTNSECSKADSSKPYCSKSYPSPISDGYGKCMSSVPEYCGNGNCGGGETYSSCPADCGSLAPKGSVEVGVYYASANDKPVSGAYVYLDGVKKGATGSDGKAIFEAAYGGREVKVECPNNDFCDSKTIQVTGSVYRSFSCGCNPAGDYDGDGYLDADESLLGTDPKDANSNFNSVTWDASITDTTGGCMTALAKVIIDWKNGKSGDDLIQAHRAVVMALNVTSVTSADVEAKPYVIASALASAKVDGVVEVGTNVTFEEAMKHADYVDGVVTSGGLLLVVTDKETGTTAIISASGACLGLLVGMLYGGGKSVVDIGKGFVIDLPVLVGKIVAGLFKAAAFVTFNTVTGRFGKIESSITGGIGGLVKGVVSTYNNKGDIFSSAVHSMVKDVLEKGNGVNIFREGRAYNKDAYLQFQVGFLKGYITGYILTVVASFFVGAGEIKAAVTAVKAGKLEKLTGGTFELAESIANLAAKFGDKAGEAISKLKYVENIAKWTDSEKNGLARIMKLNEKWGSELSEVEANVAGKHVDDLAVALKGKVPDIDAAVGNLLNTKLGRETLKLSETTPELVAKESSLVGQWGAGGVDEVVSKGFLGIGDAERISNLRRISNAMPKELLDKLTKEKAVGFLGKKGFGDAVEKVSKSFSTSDLSAAIKTVNDVEDLGTGASKILKRVEQISNIAPGATDAEKLAFFKNVAKMSAKVSDDIAEVADVKGVHKLASSITTATNEGFEFEAEMAANLKRSGKELEEISKEIKPEGFTPSEIDSYLKNGDIYEAKVHDWIKNPSGSALYLKLKGDLGEKISKFKAFQQANGLNSKITIVFKGSVEAEMKTWLETTKGVLVEVIK